MYKLNNLDKKVSSGKFFEDYTFDELVDVAKDRLYSKQKHKRCESFMPFAVALHKHINLEGSKFEFMTLKQCIEAVEESFIDEITSHIINLENNK